MLSAKERAFAEKHHHAVFSTFRKNGAIQMSIVACGPYQGNVAFTTIAGGAKLWNLKRDPRCSLLIPQSDMFGYVVLEGRARLMTPQDTAPEELRVALRDVYRVAAGKEHPNWEEYDEAMVRARRSVVIVVPERVYGWAM